MAHVSEFLRPTTGAQARQDATIAASKRPTHPATAVPLVIGN